MKIFDTRNSNSKESYQKETKHVYDSTSATKTLL